MSKVVEVVIGQLVPTTLWRPASCSYELSIVNGSNV